MSKGWGSLVLLDFANLPRKAKLQVQYASRKNHGQESQSCARAYDLIDNELSGARNAKYLASAEWTWFYSARRQVKRSKS